MNDLVALFFSSKDGIAEEDRKPKANQNSHSNSTSMKCAAALLTASLLASGALGIYPPPANIDYDDDTGDLVTIQSSKQEGLSDVDVAAVNSPKGYALKDFSDTKKDTGSSSEDSKKHGADTSLGSPFYPFYLSISMIFVSEIGDKTFLIAAIMAMRYPRMVVFSAASSALIIMTILSGAIGHVLPQILSPKLTRSAAAVLFLVFGYKLLREGLSVEKGQGVEEELVEVEEEIAAIELHELSSDMEKGGSSRGAGAGNGSSSTSEASEKQNLDWKARAKNLVYYVSSPVWFQTFSMTFLGEWGDRSQITTVAMAAGADWKMVMLGGSVGHAICTLMAVLVGQYISTKISLRAILLGGSVAFFIFSGLYGYTAIYDE